MSRLEDPSKSLEGFYTALKSIDFSKEARIAKERLGLARMDEKDLADEFRRFIAVTTVASFAMPSTIIDEVWHAAILTRALENGVPETQLTNIPSHVECAPDSSRMERTRSLVDAVFSEEHRREFWTCAANCGLVNKPPLSKT